MLSLYRSISQLSLPFLHLLMRKRIKLGKEHMSRYREKFAHNMAARPDGEIIWFHAASVGETISILPLLNKITAKSPNLHILLTTGTVTSAEIIAKSRPKNVIHQFAPFDTIPTLRRFLQHWRPQRLILTESEIWPIYISSCHEKGIPINIIGGRMSEKSLQKWLALGKSGRKIFAMIDRIYTQSQQDLQHYQQLAGDKAQHLGNLKFCGAKLGYDENIAASIKEYAGARAIIAFASTHQGEEEIILEGLHRLDEAGVDYMAIIIPRHPKRGEEVQLLMGGKLRSHNDGYSKIYIADTIGELGNFFAAADIAVMGGSLITHGGHNPLEPARFGIPIISGQFVHNFAEIYQEMQDCEAVIIAKNSDELAYHLLDLLHDKAKMQQYAENANNYAASKEDIIDILLEKVLV